MRQDPDTRANERDALAQYLDYQRETILAKAEGLSQEQLAQRIATSALTLAGILYHLALVEESWMEVRFLGLAEREEWAGVDWDADPDWEWHSAAADTPEQLMSLWQEAVRRSRRLVAKALVGGGLDQPAAFSSSDGLTPSLRRLLIDMIEEYARHVGHADLIRESVDGLVGEDPDDH